MQELKDIIYYGEQTLDVYLPENKDYTTIVYFHGGGLEGGGKDDIYYVEMARDFAKNGYAFVSVNYRKYPLAKYPDYLIDCANSVKYAKEKYAENGGNGKIIISGQSAGAWLSLMLCLNKTFLESVGVNCQDIDGWLIDSAQTTSHFNVIKYEKGLDSRSQRIDEYAPLYYVSADTDFTKMLLVYYDNDMPCRPEQNRLFEKAIKQFNSDADITVVELKGTHVHGSTVKNENGEYDFVVASLKWLKEKDL